MLADIPRDIVDGILVVDCVSSDDTIQAARQAGARVVTESAGKPGAALKRSFAELGEYEPDIVVFLDAYYRYLPSQIKRLVDPIDEAKYDLVLGARVLEGNSPCPMSKPAAFWHNRMVSAFRKEIYRLNDITPFRAMRYGALMQTSIASDDLGWLVEMPIRAFRQGFRVCEVPVKYNLEAPETPPDDFNEDSVHGRRLIWNVYNKYSHLLR